MANQMHERWRAAPSLITSMRTDSWVVRLSLHGGRGAGRLEGLSTRFDPAAKRCRDFLEDHPLMVRIEADWIALPRPSR